MGGSRSVFDAAGVGVGGGEVRGATSDHANPISVRRDAMEGDEPVPVEGSTLLAVT